ncbi:hypothetical protein AbraIFM66950_006225 [Aspergillus brasiliensis]|nr:hypothetical protein AbraIFM66950_006225 [Aspergillus brasiliensis]
MNHHADNDFASPTNPSSATSTVSNPRRTKTALPAEGPTVKFLYTIMKQMDLRSIDWASVASQLNIPSGHAARMRYSRLRAQLENQGSSQRGVRTKRAEAKRAARASSSRTQATTAPATSYPDFEPLVPIKEEIKEETKEESYNEIMPSMSEYPLAPLAMHPGSLFTPMGHPWAYYYPQRYSMDEYSMHMPTEYTGSFQQQYYGQQYNGQQYLPSAMSSFGWETSKFEPEEEEEKLDEVEAEPVDKGKSVDREIKEEVSERKPDITVIED